MGAVGGQPDQDSGAGAAAAGPPGGVHDGDRVPVSDPRAVDQPEWGGAAIPPVLRRADDGSFAGSRQKTLTDECTALGIHFISLAEKGSVTFLI